MRTTRGTILKVVLLNVIVAVTGIIVYAKVSEGADEAWLADKYGPARFSSGPEEWIIRDFFGDRHAGTFVDVGANDYQRDSNTYFLETTLGWSGIAIDALPEFATGYTQHRPRTQFFAYFVSDASDRTEQIF